MIELPRHELDGDSPWRSSSVIGPESPLSVAAALFVEHLGRRGAPGNTIAAFRADLRLFSAALGADLPIASLSTEHVRRFYAYLRKEHLASCSARSLRRRATTVQAFLRYLSEEGIASRAEAVQPEPETTKGQVEPLLSDGEIAKLHTAARELAFAGEPRALLLVSLLLSTGIGKSEFLALQVADFSPDSDAVTVGVGTHRRTLPLAAEAKQAVLGYLASGRVGTGSLFNCTGRNLEYVLARVGARAGLGRNPSFRLLRASAAARMYAGSKSVESVVRDLGISPHTWPAMRRRVTVASPSARPAEA